jgi:hypothetical protein
MEADAQAGYFKRVAVNDPSRAGDVLGERRDGE